MNRTEVLPGVWHLEEDYRVYCTLVQGKTLALLWDTGQGRTDLAAYVAQQVPTPCLVLNSHGHSDHIGGNFRFPQVYAHRGDWPLLAAYARLTGRETSVCPLEPGQCFALGGRRAEVISLAGHTKGSVGLLLAGENISGTHEAYAVYRDPAVCVKMGVSVGIIAAICARERLLPGKIPLDLLQDRLEAAGLARCS